MVACFWLTTDADAREAGVGFATLLLTPAARRPKCVGKSTADYSPAHA